MKSEQIGPARLGLFWLGIQAVWGALLGISLQSRSIELASGDALVAYGHLATWGALVAAAVQIAIGPWSDARRRNGSRRIEFYIGGSVVAAVAIVAFYTVDSFAALTAAFVVLQAAMNVATGPYQAVIPDLVPRARHGIASSWMAVFQSAGNALGALCASLLNDARALGATLAGVLLATCAATSSQVRKARLEPLPPHEPFRLGRGFGDLFVSRALVYCGFYTLLGYLLFYVRDVLGAEPLQQARLQSGLLILAFTIVGIAGAAIAARPSDRLDKRLVANAGGITVCAALATFIASHALTGAAVATAVAGFGWGIFLVADWAIACRVLPPASLATTMGIWNLALIVPQIVAPAFTTWVLQRLSITSGPSGPRAAFALALCETLLGIAWLWRLSACLVRE